MYFLRQLKKFNLPKTMMVHFYTAIIESILTSSFIIFYAAATAKEKSRLQHIIRTAEKVIGCNLPTLKVLHTSRTLRRVRSIVCPLTLDTLCSSYSPPAEGSGPLGPKLHAIRTASSHPLLASSTRTRTENTLSIFIIHHLFAQFILH